MKVALDPTPFHHDYELLELPRLVAVDLNKRDRHRRLRSFAQRRSGLRQNRVRGCGAMARSQAHR